MKIRCVRFQIIFVKLSRVAKSTIVLIGLVFCGSDLAESKPISVQKRESPLLAEQPVDSLNQSTDDPLGDPSYQPISDQTGDEFDKRFEDRLMEQDGNSLLEPPKERSDDERSDDEPSDDQRFMSDIAAQNQVRLYRSYLVESGRLSVDDTAKLKSLHQKYPGSQHVTETLKSALSVVEDWEGIIEMYQRVPAKLIDNQLLVIALIRANRFAESADLLLADAQAKESAEKAWLLGFSLYHAGRHAEAVEVLESLEKKVSGKRLLDVTSLIGLAYVQLDDDLSAEKAFEKAMTLDPNHLVSVANLASVCQRLGKFKKAKELDQKALALRSEQLKNENRAMRLNSLTRQLNQAWAAQDLDRSREIIEQMMPDADEQLKTMLESYLTEINKRSK